MRNKTALKHRLEKLLAAYFERARKQDPSLLEGVFIYEGRTPPKPAPDEEPQPVERQYPCVICTAFRAKSAGTEFGVNSGVFELDVQIEVRSSLDNRDLPEHMERQSQILADLEQIMGDCSDFVAFSRKPESGEDPRPEEGKHVFLYDLIEDGGDENIEDDLQTFDTLNYQAIACLSSESD